MAELPAAAVTFFRCSHLDDNSTQFAKSLGADTEDDEQIAPALDPERIPDVFDVITGQREPTPEPSAPHDWSRYMQRPAGAPYINREDERALLAEIRALPESPMEVRKGSPQAAVLLKEHKRYLYMHARRWARMYRVNADDMMQEACLGFLHAIWMFDPDATKGRLLNYATAWIRSYIQLSVIADYSIVKVTSRQSANLLSAGGRALRQRDSSIYDVVKSSGASKHAANYLDSLRDERPEASPAHRIEGASVRDRLRHVMRRVLTDRQRYIVEARYLAEAPAILDTIANELHLTRERIRQIEVAALKKLRRALLTAFTLEDLEELGCTPRAEEEI